MRQDEKKKKKNSREMVTHILQTQLMLKGKDRQTYKKGQPQQLDDRLWGLIMVEHFKACDTVTKGEIELYLMKQESMRRDRSEAGKERLAVKNQKIATNLFDCFTAWKKTPIGKEQAKKIETDSTKLEVGGRSVFAQLRAEKELNDSELKLLVFYDRHFQDKLGMYETQEEDVTITLYYRGYSQGSERVDRPN